MHIEQLIELLFSGFGKRRHRAVTRVVEEEVEVGSARGATELERVTDIGGQPVIIQGRSMQPTLKDGECYFLNRYVYIDMIDAGIQLDTFTCPNRGVDFITGAFTSLNGTAFVGIGKKGGY